MNNDNNDEYGKKKPGVNHIGYMQIKQVPNEELEIGEDYYFLYSGNFYFGKLVEILNNNPKLLQTSYEFIPTKMYELKYPGNNDDVEEYIIEGSDNNDNVEESNIEGSDGSNNKIKLKLTTMILPFKENTTEGGRRKTRKYKLNKRKTIKKKRNARKTNKKSSSK
jgi:hypothetical protein